MKSLAKAISFALVSFSFSLVSHAQSVNRVEVDWEVYTREPDSHIVSPQISIVMSSRVNLTSEFGEFRLNPCSDQYEGGLRVDTWNGPDELSSSGYMEKLPLASSEDEIHFTTCLRKWDGRMYYYFKGVHSEEWGDVQQSQLPYAHTSGGYDIRYSIDLTLNESEVEFGHTRVDKIIAREVRYYVDDQLAKRDMTGYYIFKDGSSYVGPISPYEIIEQYIAF